MLALLIIQYGMSGGLQLPQGRRDHRLRRGADDGWAKPILVRPHVSGSCTRVEEPTGDKTGGLERRQGGMGGVSLGD